jgi:poly-beta-1,6-N-acetyl-D-glucosamine synthase
MRFVFWCAIIIVGYTYFGYMLFLWVRCRWHRQTVKSCPHLPFLTIVLVVRNEVNHIDQKLRSLMALNYPPEKMQIIVVSDGSTDGTNRVLSEFAQDSRVHPIIRDRPQGKAAGLNEALKSATGEVVVFMDARQTVAKEAMLRLMENFGDTSVGCASGVLMLGDPAIGESVRGLGLYWKIEKITRELESASGSVIGATGALYAVRRNLLVPLPPETILDDVFIPMQVVRQGYRVVLDSRARIWDAPDLGTGREFARKVRTLSGVYQLLQIEPWLLSRSNPMRFEFVSHKLLRLAVPFVLCAALISSVFVPTTAYRTALVVQLMFYGLSICGWLKLSRNPLAGIADAAFTFVLLNAAATVAFANFISGHKPAWGR